MYLPLPHHPVQLQRLPHRKTALAAADLQPHPLNCLQERCIGVYILQ